MQIIIQSVTIDNRGKFKLATVNYQNSEGKIETKNVASFGNKELYETLSNAKTGDAFDVQFNKNDRGYWEFTSAVPLDAGTVTINKPVAGKATATPVTKSSYETSEERAARQKFIIKQSSIANAIAVLTIGAKTAPAAADVLKLADFFVGYVMEKDQTQKEPDMSIGGLESELYFDLT